MSQLLFRVRIQEYHTYTALLLLLLLPINSCLPFDNTDINAKNKNLLIDGKTLREKINLKIRFKFYYNLIFLSFLLIIA